MARCTHLAAECVTAGPTRQGWWGDTICLMRHRTAGALTISAVLFATGCSGRQDVTADWTAASQPAATATKVAAIVEERACSSGQPAAGRIQKPEISYGRSTITITFRIRAIGGNNTCQAVRGSAYEVKLSQPVGSRRLLNGRTRPAVPAG